MEKEEKLRKLALSALEGSSSNKEICSMLGSLGVSKQEVLDGYLLYNLDVTVYSNEVYEHLGTRFAMYLQNLLSGSWHIRRQKVVLDMVEQIKPNSIADMGFGVPGRYIKDYVLENKISLSLVDFYDSAFDFAEKLLHIWNPKWKENISFRKLDMNNQTHVGDFDCYLFMDSIEHINDPAKYLNRTVKKSPPGSKFIFSIPIGPMIPSHTIEWKTEEEAIRWLTHCGLVVDRKEKIYPNPKVDLFATETTEEFYDLVVSCRKKYEVTNLPLLDEVKNLYLGDNLENTLLIVCQHILMSNLILLDYLIKLGIKPGNVFLIGKSYSTCPRTMKDYRRLGVNVDEKSLAFDSHVSFDEQFSKYIKKFLKDISNRGISKYDKVLILDDGGQLLLQANKIFKGDKRVVGIEQTSSGYNKISKLKLNFPVINVATSRAKLDYETPIIVEAISKEIFKRLRQKDKFIETILVIGNGPIGKGLADDFRKDYKVYVYDKQKEKTCISDKEFLIMLTGCDMIIGCSGEIGISESFYPLLKKEVILVSASSSDREFESHKIRRKHAKTSNTHKDFHTEEVILLNGGFPLNFDGHKLSVPLEEIQLTEALMFAGAIQAIQAPYKKEIIDLDSGAQKMIIEKFESL